MYRVSITKTFEKQLGKLPDKVQTKILQAVQLLKSWEVGI